MVVQGNLNSFPEEGRHIILIIIPEILYIRENTGFFWLELQDLTIGPWIAKQKPPNDFFAK